MDNGSNLKSDNTSVNTSELLLGLGFIGLGTYFVFRSAFRASMKGPMAVHHVPIDITFSRFPPNYNATVTMSNAGAAPCLLDITYDPVAYVSNYDSECLVGANQTISEQFDFTANVPVGGHLSVTACVRNSNDPDRCHTKSL